MSQTKEEFTVKIRSLDDERNKLVRGRMINVGVLLDAAEKLEESEYDKKWRNGMAVRRVVMVALGLQKGN